MKLYGAPRSSYGKKWYWPENPPTGDPVKKKKWSFASTPLNTIWQDGALAKQSCASEHPCWIPWNHECCISVYVTIHGKRCHSDNLLSLILKFMNCVSDYYLHQHTFANAATTETQGCFCLPLRNAVYIKLICNSKFVLKETHLHFLSICSFSIMRKWLIAVFIWRFCPKSISHLSSSLIYPFTLSFSWRNWSCLGCWNAVYNISGKSQLQKSMPQSFPKNLNWSILVA